MQLRSLGIVALIVLCATLYRTTQGQAAATPAPSRVGVVDIQRVLAESRAARESEKELKEWIKTVQKDIDEAQAKMKKIDEDLQLLDRRSGAYQQAKDQFDLEKLKYEQLGRRLEKEQEQRWVDAVQRNYEDAVKEIRGYAKAHGFDVVLEVDSTPLRARSREELFSRLQWKNVVYADESLDITSDVLKILGAQ
ncbi:MAG: OmpH family outer membrane protein [Planctomycetota bacterium]